MHPAQKITNLTGFHAQDHKVLIYKEYHSVCPLVGIGTLPIPLSPASVPPSPRGRGHTRLRVRGWESPNSDEGTYTVIYVLYVQDHPSGDQPGRDDCPAGEEGKL
jgi:hypothetical protein